MIINYCLLHTKRLLSKCTGEMSVLRTTLQNDRHTMAFAILKSTSKKGHLLSGNRRCNSGNSYMIKKTQPNSLRSLSSNSHNYFTCLMINKFSRGSNQIFFIMWIKQSSSSVYTPQLKNSVISFQNKFVSKSIFKNG